MGKTVKPAADRDMPILVPWPMLFRVDGRKEEKRVAYSGTIRRRRAPGSRGSGPVARRVGRTFGLVLALAAGAAGVAADECSPTPLDGGAPIDLDAYRGRLLYLDFWASWCSPCRKSFPFMNALQRELGDRGLAILAVSVDEHAEDARGFLERVPAEFPVARDDTGGCPEAFGVRGMPSSYLIGRDGSVIHRHTGFRESDAAGLRDLILQTLQGPR